MSDGRRDWWPEEARTLAQAHALRASILLDAVEGVDAWEENRPAVPPISQDQVHTGQRRRTSRVRLAAAHAATAQALQAVVIPTRGTVKVGSLGRTTMEET